MKYLLLTIFLSPALGQYAADMGMKPDVTFGEINDRFDLTDLVEKQNRYFDQPPSDAEEDDYRRKNDGKKEPNSLTIQIGRRSDVDANNFAYHDLMEPSGADTVADFNENLQKFQNMNSRRAQGLIEALHGRRKRLRRRNAELSGPDAEKEVLLHHAVPIDLTIEGFLQPSLVV